jgi:hypothetical protein
MAEKVLVDVDEIKRVFEAIEKIHDFLHQPLNHVDIESFAKRNYPEINDVYYNVVWSWLPSDTKKLYRER